MDHLTLAPTDVMLALGTAALKATALLALAALLTRLLRRRAAALRHLVWTVGLASVVAILVLPVVLPAWRVIPMPTVALVVGSAREGMTTPPMRAEPGTVATRQERVAPAAPRARDAANVRTGIENGSHTAARASGISWPAMLAGMWLIGVVLVVARYASSRVALIRLTRSSTPAGESAALMEQLTRQMRITRPVCLRSSDDVELPFTWGMFRPQIVLPGDAHEWTPECRRHVLQHELAHIKRLDAATQLVAQAASALFWFHPLVWYAVGQMRSERERACDDFVLASGAAACDYADDLLAIVTTYGYVERHVGALAFARRSNLEGRLLALLDPRIERGVLSPRRRAAVLSLSATLVVPLATLERAEARTVPRAPVHVSVPAVQTTSAVVNRPTAVVSRSVAPVLVRSAAPAEAVVQHVETRSSPSELDVFEGCALRTWEHESEHSSSSRDGAMSVWTASGQNDDCAFDLKSEGSILFNQDGSAIERIAAGGYFDASTNIRGDVTRLVVRPTAAGSLSYELTRNGQRADFATAGLVWYEQFLIGLDRTTAFAIDKRFPLLLATGGPGNALSEVEHMHSDQARLYYLRRLIQATTLDGRAIGRIADIATSMYSGYESAELIVAIASRYSLTDPAARVTFVRAALAMESDHELVRTLLAIAGRSTLSREEMAAVLGRVPKIHGDYEKGHLLEGLLATQQLDGDLRAAYAAAADAIGDPRTRARAMSLVPRG